MYVIHNYSYKIMLLDKDLEPPFQPTTKDMLRFWVGYAAWIWLEWYIIFQSPLRNSVNDTLGYLTHEFRDILGTSDSVAHNVVWMFFIALFLTLPILSWKLVANLHWKFL